MVQVLCDDAGEVPLAAHLFEPISRPLRHATAERVVGEVVRESLAVAEQVVPLQREVRLVQLAEHTLCRAHGGLVLRPSPVESDGIGGPVVAEG